MPLTNTGPLTSQLDTIFQGKRIVDPGPAPANPLAQIFGRAGDILDAKYTADQRNRQNLIFSQEQSDRGAANKAIITGADVLTSVNDTQDAPASAPVSPALSGDLSQAVSGLAATSKAVSSGRIPASAKPLALEKAYTQLLHQYPDNAAAIQGAFRQAGYDHYLFRAADYALQDQDSDHNMATQMEQTALGAASKIGLYDPNRTKEENILTGRKALQLQEEHRLQSENLDIVTKLQNLDQNKFKFQQTQVSHELTNTINSETDMKMGAFKDRLATLAQAAQDHPESAGDIEKAVSDMTSLIEVYRTNVIGRYRQQFPTADPSVFEAVDKHIDDVKSAVTALTSGPSSMWAQNNRSYEFMTTTLGMKAADAAPKYALLSKILGPAGLNQLFLGTPQLSPDQLKDLKGELSGISFDDKQGSAVHINNVVRVMKGEAVLRDMSFPEAKKVISTIVPSIQGNAQQLLKNPKDPVAQQAWYSGYGQIVLAAKEVPPTTSDKTSIINASNAIADSNSRTAIENMIRTPETKEQGLSLMMASRASTAHILETAKHNPQTNDMYAVHLGTDGQYGVYVVKSEYDKEKQQHEVMRGQQPSLKNGLLPSQTFKEFPSMESFASRPPDDLTAVASAMNKDVDHLVSTSRYDDSTSGMTGAELRTFYTSGSIPERLQKQRAVESSKNPTISDQAQQLRKDEEAFTHTIISDPTTAIDHPVGSRHYESKVNEVEGQQHLPEGLLFEVINKETGGSWNPTIVNRGGSVDQKTGERKKSSATGLGQFTNETAKTFGIDATNPTQSIEAAGKYLRQLKDKYGSWDKAIEHYGTTARTNWAPGEAGDKAQAELKAHFRRIAGE